MHSHQLPKQFFPFLLFFLKKQGKRFAAAQGFALAWAIDHTFWPYILMLVIDGVTNFTGDRAQIWSHLATPLWMGAILWVVLEISFRMAGFLMAKAVPKLEAQVRMSMFDYVQHHSHQYFSDHLAGSIANKITDMSQSLSHIVQMVIYLFSPVVLAFIISSLLFLRLNPYFALILIGWVSLEIGIAFVFSRKCDKLAETHSESRSQLAGKIVDIFTNISAVRLFSRHNFEKNYVQLFQKDEQEKHTKSLIYVEKMKLGMGLANFIGTGIITNVAIIYAWQLGLITAGEMVFIFNTTWNINMMTWVATLELPTLYKEIGVCKQALSLIKDPHDIVDEPQAPPLKITKGEITFENVTFHYRPDYNIFQDKNITINAGEKVGLVGFSGSGKSTFVHLILRYFDVEKGRILIDGQDIATITQESLRRQIGFIPQDASLFHRSLFENIRYGDLEAAQEAVIEASKRAHCHEFVELLPEHYATLVGERGIKLSGGQRQRIAIARALLKNAPILILDEATSALDSVTERHIQEGLHDLMEGKTTLVIAHRLSTLSGMDRLLVFHEGQIIEEGSHLELLAAGGHYATLWHMQAGGFLPDHSAI